MRYWISAMLLATAAAAPAYAQDGSFGDRGGHHDGGGNYQDGGHHDGGHHDDGQRGGGPKGGRSPAPQAQPQVQQQQQRAPSQGFGGRQDGRPQTQMPPQQGNRQDPRAYAARPGNRGGNGQGGDVVQVWRNQYDARRGYDQHSGRPAYQGQGYQSGDPRAYQGNRGGDYRGGNGYYNERGQRSGGDWNRDWRQDRRYDWQGWRNSHRDIFRGGGYRPPYGGGYGYGYQRFGIGIRIAPLFFAQQYWIADPWEYRLPPAYEPYRWVRYYDDALLVDLESGEVVDVIPNFFY